MRGKNRSRSTISQLPPEVRDVVDEMVKGDEHLHARGYPEVSGERWTSH